VVIYRWFIKPALFSLPAEWAHVLSFDLLRAVHRIPGVRKLMRATWGALSPTLRVRALGLDFPSPVLLAAGFDKNAEGYDALCSLGFGAVEVGTITARAQPGNPRPRLFRLAADRALLNRMGFNNCGSEAAAVRLCVRRTDIVGVNIGKTKLAADSEAINDYVESAERLGPLADYLVVNVSSPNTPGLRDLQAAERLRPLLMAVRDALRRVASGREPALLVKIAPDLSDDEIIGIADLAIELGLQGIVATNTTISRAGLVTPSSTLAELGAGGISGAPVKARALAVLRLLRARAGKRLTLVAAGGIESVEDAWARLEAGASLVQLYTAFIYEGPGLPRKIARGLLARAREQGFSTLAGAIAHHHTAQAPGAAALSDEGRGLSAPPAAGGERV
jgi:dihydroorotate dehydrogenase